MVKWGNGFFGDFFGGRLISRRKPKKMSESQTKAGNQGNLENLKKFENLKFKIAQVDPRDMLNNFCFHV